jgi:hypothetical protein
MAIASIEKNVQVTLTLSESEAEWLKALVQNPINVQVAEDEHQIDSDIRHTIWNALSEITI